MIIVLIYIFCCIKAINAFLSHPDLPYNLGKEKNPWLIGDIVDINLHIRLRIIFARERKELRSTVNRGTTIHCAYYF